MTNLFDYSQTPASNNSASPNGAPEGMLPSTVNDVMRQMMANSAGAFNCYTAGGTANAQTVTMDPALAAYSTKVRIAFIPVANNTGACTLNVNSLGATSIKTMDGSDLLADMLDSSGTAEVQYDGTNFVLLNPAHVRYGSFTISLSGMTAATQGTVDYRINGDIVTLSVESDITGTSNATGSITGSNVPAAIQPSVDRTVLCAGIKDNGSDYAGACSIVSSSNVISFSRLTVSGSDVQVGGGFTGSGTKGIDSIWTITYKL